MKITYKVDPQGRIMIPSYIRKDLKIEPGTTVIIDVNGGGIRIRNAQSVCFVCGKTVKKPSDMIAMHGSGEMSICSACAKKIEEESKKRG